MVVFTCNNCGESLQKPKVEKHYSTVCRKAGKRLTCVDCFKDFLNEEYVDHIKCVTEEERYAAKGTFPKGVVKKGDVKQESWMEMVKSAIKTTANVPPGQQQVIQVLSASVNVPRKKHKFINFITNSYGNKISQKDIEAVWNVIEKYKNENSPPAESKNKSDENSEEKKTDEEESTNVVDIGSVDNQERKSKKKKKPKDVAKEDEILNANSNVENNTEKTKKKKKKSKQDSDQIDAAVESSAVEKKKDESENAGVNGSAEAVPIKKKKNKKSKNKEIDVETKAREENPSAIEAEKELKKVKRKSKSEQNNDENEQLNGNLHPEQPSKKKRKSKASELSENHLTNAAEPENNDKQVSNNNAEAAAKPKKRKMRSAAAEGEASAEKQQKVDDDANKLVNGSFCFKAKIAEVITAKKSILLEKLQKLVMKDYQKIFGEEAAVKARGKFLKHLRKVDGIEISADTVRLIDN